MITNNPSDSFKHITKVSILDSKKAFYPLRYALSKRNITINESECLTVMTLPEDVTYPSTVKTGDNGMLYDYKIGITVTNQDAITEEQLMKFLNKKVIVVLHHAAGRIIFGCNELPLQFIFNDDNATVPSATTGFSIDCRGVSYIPKVNLSL